MKPQWEELNLNLEEDFSTHVLNVPGGIVLRTSEFYDNGANMYLSTSMVFIPVAESASGWIQENTKGELK